MHVFVFKIVRPNTTLAKTFEGDINIQENVHGEETTDKKMKSMATVLSYVTALAFEQANGNVCKG